MVLPKGRREIMSLPLTPDILRAAYDFLCVLPPFNSWALPDSDDVKFVVIRSRTDFGRHNVENGRHIIGLSSNTIGQIDTLIRIMAHEMIHAYQYEAKMETADVAHNAAFFKLAHRVSRIHGFDPKAF